MRTTITLVFALTLLTSCSKNETQQNTESADYVETIHDSIYNPTKDSIIDSVETNTAMPPQPKVDSSGL